MKMMKKLAAVFAAATLLVSSCAVADEISFSGTVTNTGTVEVYASIGGTVASVPVKVGQKVTADDVIAEMKTTKVYAESDGTVTGIFGEPGDSASVVAERYGAVMYVEEDVKYTISASTDDAYNTTETKFVHIGETVYIQSRSDSSRTGTGIITAIEGTSYTVRVETGTFLLSEKCYLYRSESHKAALRIGSGSISRKSPTAVTGSGSIVSIAVTDGAAVKKGDLLFETLDGTFDGYYMTGLQMYAGVNGTVAQLNVTEGGAVQKDSIVAVIYPENSMRIEASVNEDDLSQIKVGDPVSIELNWNQDDDVKYEGTIAMISAIADSASAQGQDAGSTVTYTVYIDFTADADTRYGMSAFISTIDTEAEEEPVEETTAAEEPAAEEAAASEETDADAKATPSDGASFPEGMTPPDGASFPEGMTPPDGASFPEGMTPPDGVPTQGTNE